MNALAPIAGSSTLVAHLPSLTSAGARAVLNAAEARAERDGLSVAIAVVDAAGHLLAFQRMNGAPLIAVAVSAGKARTAAFIKAPTKFFQSITDGGQPSLLAAEGLVPIEGGVPVVIAGSVVGAIGVSGAQSEDDVRVAQAGADGLRDDEVPISAPVLETI